jgi:hypothetical protein
LSIVSLFPFNVSEIVSSDEVLIINKPECAYYAYLLGFKYG